MELAITTSCLLPLMGKSQVVGVIWLEEGGIVYDNQFNTDDTADPTTAIGGGSIVIHKE